jgi:hypothetical protein
VFDPTTADGLRYFDTGEKQKLIETVGYLLLICVLVLFCTLLYTRRKLLTLAVELDKETYTQSDFAVIGRFMDFHDFTKEGMQQEIEMHFKAKY